MMKRLLVSLLLVAGASCLCAAQVRVGVNACPQINESFGARVGTDVDVPLGSRWSLVPGVYWSLRSRTGNYGETRDGVDVRVERSHVSNFVSVPVRVGVRFPMPKVDGFEMQLLFGPYLAYGLGGTFKTTENSDGTITSHETGSFSSDGCYKGRFDYGMNTGLNCVFRDHFTVGVFSEGGYRKIYKTYNVFEDIIGDILLVNKVSIAVGFTLGYRF